MGDSYETVVVGISAFAVEGDGPRFHTSRAIYSKYLKAETEGWVYVLSNQLCHVFFFLRRCLVSSEVSRRCCITYAMTISGITAPFLGGVRIASVEKHD